MKLTNKLRSMFLAALILPMFVSLTEASEGRSGRPAQMQKAGFTALFNGKDLKGWKGLVANPIKRSKMTAAELVDAQKKADAEMRDSWKVVNGELHFAGHGNNIATVKKYGDFEMFVDWKIFDDGKQEGDAPPRNGGPRTHLPRVRGQSEDYHHGRPADAKDAGSPGLMPPHTFRPQHSRR